MRLAGGRKGAAVFVVDRKSKMDLHRFDHETPGYTLLNVYTACQGFQREWNGAVDNLLNKEYQMPLGGVNIGSPMARDFMGRIRPVTGEGRSADFGMTIRF